MVAITRQMTFKLAGAGLWMFLACGLHGTEIRAEARTPNGVTRAEGPRVIYSLGFEKGEKVPALKGHTLAAGAARSGERCLTGEVTKERQAAIFEFPLTVIENASYQCAFYVRGDGRGAGCAVWLADADGKKMENIQKLTPVPKAWTRVQATFTAKKSGPLHIQIATPSSFNGAPGRTDLDDITVEETTPQFAWPERVQNFPAIAASGAAIWMAALERDKLVRKEDGFFHIDGAGNDLSITVQRFEGGKPAGQCTLAPKGATGLAGPALCATPEGCVVAFPAELNEKWRIAYAFIGPEASGVVDCQFIESEATAAINPALAAAGGRVCAVWESNAGAARGIDAAWLTRAGAEKPVRISDAGANSYNPTIVALPDGSLEAAWDSVHGAQANIFGAAWRGGAWQAERRLTDGPRIERHPCLAARGGEIWLAWQAQSYGAGGAAPKKADAKANAKKGNAQKAKAKKVAADAGAKNEIRINAVNEQRIVVARLDGMQAPRGLFEKVSPAGDFLMRPRIAFDAGGRLWVTARRSLGQNAGWEPLAWSYEGGAWSGPVTLLAQQGRWQAVPLAATATGMAAVVQFDEIPPGRDQQGLTVDWRSGAVVRDLASGGDARATLKTEPLAMPPTEFSLERKQELISANFPRQHEEHGGKALTLLWGDLHDHTDISICGRAINPPGHDLFANERDIEKLDFCALTDHGYNFDTPQWRYNAEQTRYNHDPGRFVTFLGEEWTSSKNDPADPSKPIGPGNSRRYGHHNFIFLDSHYQDFYDSYDGDITPADVWKQIGDHDFVCIPHELADWQGQGSGNPPTDWSFTDERLQPVAEIFQARQSYEYFGAPRQSPTGAPFAGYYYLQDAWAKGIVIGVIASPDHGGGSGKAGVWATEFTREGIFEALRARHTFGTSGAKMSLFLRAGAAMMGDKVARPSGPLKFEVKASALRPIKELVIFRNNQVAFRIEPNKTEVRAEWTEEKMPQEKRAWYYARIHATDDELAWTSPIWFE